MQFRCQLIFLKSIYHFYASQNPKYNTFPYIHNEQSIPKNIYIFPKFLKLILGEKKIHNYPKLSYTFRNLGFEDLGEKTSHKLISHSEPTSKKSVS